ncbi:glutamate decarboxylase [Pseudogymnoascus destructans 20631-21]|uniref:Glutamate decarboxylase n=2 Tax=Pseudogymnoascus destructans TaxID=655981 RepID=L8FZA5_PSED2|nr:glutamate decarboxylase [Pseudogymnoascus destructans 20631-21]
MVHLTGIPTDSSLQPSSAVDGAAKEPESGPVKQLGERLAKAVLTGREQSGQQAGEQFMTSVYASRYAAEDLPKHEMPEGGMPKEVAYRMIKDETSLDGNPMLNLASFVTTFMEKEVEDLMTESLAKNFIDYEEYPRTAEIQNRCVSMIGRLFNAPVHSDAASIGTSTVGSSEAVMLATLAMKKRWQNKRKAEGKPFDKPNMIMSSAVQVVWEKAMRYFEVEEKYVYCTKERYVLDPKETVDLVDENTIGICVILGTTYTGQYEDAKAINDLLDERGLDTPINIDAASGGFVAPFVVPELEWDFRLSHVVSINVSGHKYGLVYPGVGWVIWRDPEFLPKELVFNVNYLGADQASFTLNFSKGASQIIGQYYQLIRLGKNGYRAIMLNLTRTADLLAAALKDMGFLIMSDGEGRGLPLVAFRLDSAKEKRYDEFAIAHQLRERGWIVPAYTMAPHTDEMKMLRVVIREDFSRSRCEQLICDMRLSLGLLDEMDKRMLKEYTDYIGRQRAHAQKLEGQSQHDVYKGEEHSLQGTTGKTHGIC